MRRRLVPAVALLALVPGACGGDDAPTAAGDDASTTAVAERELTGTLRVFAASSLTEAFTELGQAFEADHPGVQVTFNFAASSALAQQLNEGGSADVFVSADEANLRKVTDAGSADAASTQVIARNRLSILVEPGNPKAIKGLSDLAKADVVTVLCAPEVPCGKYAAAALTKAGVTVKPASLEENVKGVVSKVTLGEADAGIVYVTDVRAAKGKAEGVDIELADDPALEAVYPMAGTSRAANAKAAAVWRTFVVSEEGQAVLAKYGFLAP
jgi:molybdate transport system substrate-binding protein